MVPTQVVIASVVMVATFAAGISLLRRCPVGTLLIVCSVLTAAAAGFGFPVRHLVEGMFTYFNIVLVCATGAIFLAALEDSGAAAAMTRSLVLRFHAVPALLLVVMMLLLLVPGMLTGIAVNSVLSVGVLVAPIMIGLGIPRTRTAVIIGIGAILSMVMPPTNLLAMSIAMGINAPFEGFTLPTLMLSVPLTVLTGLALGLPHMRKIALADLVKVLPDDYGLTGTFRPWLPLVVVVGVMTAIRLFPGAVPDIGTPLTFMIGTGVAGFSGRRFAVLGSVRRAMSGPILGILELLVGIGVFVQIATLTGIRGLLVTSSLSLPHLLAYLAAATALIVSGGLLSPFGAGAIFGVPFVLFFLDRNQIVTIVAISLLAALSQFSPPTAIAGRFAADVAGVDDYKRVWRASLIPVGALAVIGLAIIAWADRVAALMAAITPSGW
jgi:TRAP-type C4-dicarboxylate transport system permease large subunit